MDNKKEFDFLNTREAAAIIRRSPLTLARMRKAGTIPFYCINGQCLVDRADLIAYLERQRRNSEMAVNA